jgi:putative component of membrane protein insertase Oxa1/YidC/SpoIIIJ protein YidD
MGDNPGVPEGHPVALDMEGNQLKRCSENSIQSLKWRPAQVGFLGLTSEVGRCHIFHYINSGWDVTMRQRTRKIMV